MVSVSMATESPKDRLSGRSPRCALLFMCWGPRRDLASRPCSHAGEIGNSAERAACRRLTSAAAGRPWAHERRWLAAMADRTVAGRGRRHRGPLRGRLAAARLRAPGGRGHRGRHAAHRRRDPRLLPGQWRPGGSSLADRDGPRRHGARQLRRARHRPSWRASATFCSSGSGRSRRSWRRRSWARGAQHPAQDRLRQAAARGRGCGARLQPPASRVATPCSRP